MSPLFGLFSFGKKKDKDDETPLQPNLPDSSVADPDESAPDTAKYSSRNTRRRSSFEVMVKKKSFVSEANIDEAKKIKRKRLVESDKCVMLIDLGNILIEMNLVSESDHAKLYSSEFRIPFVKLSNYAIKKDVVSLIDPEIARKYWVFPIDKIGRTITLAMFSPATHIIESVAEETELKFKEVVSTRTEIIDCINKYYGAEGEDASSTGKEEDVGEDTTQQTVRLNAEKIEDRTETDIGDEPAADIQESLELPGGSEFPEIDDMKKITTVTVKKDSQRRKQTVRLYMDDGDILSTDDPGVVEEADSKKDTNRIFIEDGADLFVDSGDLDTLSRLNGADQPKPSGIREDIDFTDIMGENAPLIVETGREMVAAPVTEQEFSAATSGKSMNDWFDDWVKMKRPSQASVQPISSEIYNLFVGRKL